MVITAIIAATSLLPKPLTLDVTSASLFKNGYAVVVREAALSGDGEYEIDDMPQAVLGTMWISATSGTKINSVIVTTQETDSERPVQNLDEILRANIGRELKMRVSDRVLEGKLISADGQLLVVQEAGGTRAVNKSAVFEVFANGELAWKVPTKSSKHVMKVGVSAPAGARLSIVSLERGITWVPGYSIDITSDKKLRLVSKATILNDLAKLPSIEVRLITGFPNVPFVGYWDPLTAQQSVDQFVGQLMQLGTPADIRARRDSFASQMGAPAPAAEPFDKAFNISPLPGLSAEDLFFYRLPKVSLEKGDRAYYVLLALESEFSHIYEWDIPDKINNSRYMEDEGRPGDVWHSLKFKNTSNQPLTTGPATIFKNGEILGQDSLLYTSVGTETVVKITKAMDVRADDFEEEIGRESLAQTLRGNWYDVVTLKGTLSISNLKKEKVEVKVTKELTGETIGSEGDPKIVTITRGLRAVNPRQRLEWTVPLEPGAKRTLTYTYKVYLLR